MFGHDQMQAVITAISEFAAEVGNPKWEWTAPVADEALAAKVAEVSTDAITAAYQVADKLDRQDAVKAAKKAAVEAIASEDGWSEDDVKGAFGKLEKKVYAVPEKLDSWIARLKLKSMGVRIDKLTPEQKKYLASWEIGT